MTPDKGYPFRSNYMEYNSPYTKDYTMDIEALINDDMTRISKKVANVAVFMCDDNPSPEELDAFANELNNVVILLKGFAEAKRIVRFCE